MKKAHLDYKTEDALGFDFYRVNNDVNGNPRYVIHWLAFADDYVTAKARANKLGYKVYRGREFGGGFVTQSYSIQDHAERIIDERQER